MTRSLIAIALCLFDFSTAEISTVESTRPAGASGEVCLAAAHEASPTVAALLLQVHKASITTDALANKSACECPAWCSERPMPSLSWDKKCWVYQCQHCEDWKNNCDNIYKSDAMPICQESSCVPRETKEGNAAKPCQWWNCMGCDGWFKKCNNPDCPAVNPFGPECPDWCISGKDIARYQRGKRSWKQKCWVTQCQRCVDWKTECSTILQDTTTRCAESCADDKENDNRCKWVNIAEKCASCDWYKELCR